MLKTFTAIAVLSAMVLSADTASAGWRRCGCRSRCGYYNAGYSTGCNTGCNVGGCNAGGCNVAPAGQPYSAGYPPNGTYDQNVAPQPPAETAPQPVAPQQNQPIQQQPQQPAAPAPAPQT